MQNMPLQGERLAAAETWKDQESNIRRQLDVLTNKQTLASMCLHSAQ